MTNLKDNVLNERAQQILGDVVDLYTETGQPVGSKLLAEHSSLKMSPATMRNVMRDLEEAGYLTHPHTSAGRMPTENGYRFYVNNLVQVSDVEKEMRAEIKSKIIKGRDVNEVITDVSQTLSDMSGSVGLVTAPKHETDPLEQVEFLRLSGDRVLVVMVTQNGKIENRVIEVPAFISVDDLNAASLQMKELVVGQTLEDARADMIANLAEQRGRINEVIDQMMNAAQEWGEPVVSDGALVVSGSTNLFQYPELVRERLQGLISMFEEKRLLMALMDEVQKGEGIKVFIGQDCQAEAAQDCSVIANTYGTDDKKVIGTLGVIGPMRMNYKQTIGLVDYTGRLLSQYLSENQEEK